MSDVKLDMKKGFTLIELLIVISIIGIVIAISVFGISGARESSRDARRKADLELIRAGLEIYKADCGGYPATLTSGTSLTGTLSTGTCLTTNTYIGTVPSDPIGSTTHIYKFSMTGSQTYELCSSLEQGETEVTCGGNSSGCGTAGPCNYKVTNP